MVISIVVSGIHRRLSDFIHSVVVHRRDEAIRGWRNWLREDLLVHPYKWHRPDLVHLAPFLHGVSLILHLVGLGFGIVLTGLRKNSVKLGFPTFAALGKERPALRSSIGKFRIGCLCCLGLRCRP